MVGKMAGVMAWGCLLLALVACSEEGVRDVPSDVGTGSVTLLREVDGVKVYRFYDGTNRVYFTTLGETSWRESCGKNCTRDMRTGGAGQTGERN